jgi:hypothetical protein
MRCHGVDTAMNGAVLFLPWHQAHCATDVPSSHQDSDFLREQSLCFHGCHHLHNTRIFKHNMLVWNYNPLETSSERGKCEDKNSFFINFLRKSRIIASKCKMKNRSHQVLTSPGSLWTPRSNLNLVLTLFLTNLFLVSVPSKWQWLSPDSVQTQCAFSRHRWHLFHMGHT